MVETTVEVITIRLSDGTLALLSPEEFGTFVVAANYDEQEFVNLLVLMRQSAPGMMHAGLSAMEALVM